MGRTSSNLNESNYNDYLKDRTSVNSTESSKFLEYEKDINLREEKRVT